MMELDRDFIGRKPVGEKRIAAESARFSELHPTNVSIALFAKQTKKSECDTGAR